MADPTPDLIGKLADEVKNNKDETQAKLDEILKKQEELAVENEKLKKALAKKGGTLPVDVALESNDLGTPYDGPSEMLLHPVLKQPVFVKQALVADALKQGFTRLAKSA